MGTWAAHLLRLAAAVAAKSKDPSTKVGCVIVGDDHEVLSTGFNGLPIGVADLPERMERPVKYDWTVHAEANAIAFAARHGHALKGSRLFCTLRPCAGCARLIIQAGIREVHVPAAVPATVNAGAHALDLAEAMLREAGVNIYTHHYP